MGRRWFWAIGIVLIGTTGPAFAADNAGIGMVVGIEKFRWAEFGGTGETLLKETGPLLRIGATYNNLRRASSGAIYDAEGRVYFGSVDYDGQACDIMTGTCSPSKSDTNYFGIRVEGAGGYRLAHRRKGLDVFGGGGFEFWLRDIEDTASASGALEEYFSFFLKAGIGLSHEFRSAHLRFQAGASYPVYTLEILDDNFLLDVETLNPRGRAAGFAKLHVEYGPSTRQRLGMTLYYDSLHFSESRHKIFDSVIGLVEVWQPDSRRKLVGVEFNWYFR
jgi:hypothetical protein